MRTQWDTQYFFSLTMTLTNENIHAKYLNSQQTNKPVTERRKKQLEFRCKFWYGEYNWKNSAKTSELLNVREKNVKIKQHCVLSHFSTVLWMYQRLKWLQSTVYTTTYYWTFIAHSLTHSLTHSPLSHNHQSFFQVQRD